MSPGLARLVLVELGRDLARSIPGARLPPWTFGEDSFADDLVYASLHLQNMYWRLQSEVQLLFVEAAVHVSRLSSAEDDGCSLRTDSSIVVDCMNVAFLCLLLCRFHAFRPILE